MRKIQYLILVTIFSLVTFSFTHAQEAEITGWQEDEWGLLTCTGCTSVYSMISPTIRFADSDEDPWEVNAIVSITSGSSNVTVENYYPIAGPNPNTHGALKFTFTGNFSAQVTFQTVYSGSVYSSQTYTITQNDLQQ
ncbi:MAG: hypothetical protein MI700_04340 [Balneolales bacterium]|nr:hypothetical protein [Balneolales bacterium]